MKMQDLQLKKGSKKKLKISAGDAKGKNMKSSKAKSKKAC